jgi:hypothetical protein
MTIVASLHNGDYKNLICRAAGVTVGPISTHSHFTENILRAGLNYQFH